MFGNDKGFTLLETVVGLSLVFILLSVSIIIYGNIKTLDLQSEVKIEKVNLISDKVDIIRNAEDLETINSLDWGGEQLESCSTYVENTEDGLEGYSTELKKIIISCDDLNGDVINLEVYNKNL